MKIKVFYIISFLLVSFGLSARSVDDIELSHRQNLSFFDDLKSQGKLADKSSLQLYFKEICGSIGLEKFNYLHLLHQDIALVKKEIKSRRKQSGDSGRLTVLAGRLMVQLKFLKKYRLPMDVTAHHALMKVKWGDMFDLIDNGGDVLPALSAKGINKSGKKGLKLFIYKVQRCLDKVEEHEDRLHADWVDLKLKNYVLKIELIRLRNAAIFHPLYKGLRLKTSYPK